MQDERLQKPQRAREFSKLGVEFAAAAIDWPGQPGKKLVPDSTKAYCRFEICFAWPVRTAYGTSFHPGTLANSADSMLHQVFNRAHKMKAYAPQEARDGLRDENFGSLVGVEVASQRGYGAGYRMGTALHYEVAAVIHKQVSFVPKLLGEHLGGRHKYAVSQEVQYTMLDSGFIIEANGRAPKSARAIMDQYTPEEFKALNLAYVPVLLTPDTLCPDELLDCYSPDEMRVTRDWHGQRVTVCKGGINGQVHFQGVGMVRYGAENEAQIQQLLATDPDRIEADGEDGGDEGFVDALKIISENSKKLLTHLSTDVLRASL